MKRESQQLDERGQLEARIRDAHKQMRQYSDTLKGFESHFKERPRGAAEALWLVLPVHLEVWRQHALSRFGVDLEDHEQRQKRRWTHVVDAFEYTLLAIKYDAFDSALLYMTRFYEEGERGERLARLVCASYLLALRNTPGMMAATIETFQRAVPHLANETGLAGFLAGYLVTHTSLHANPRLRHGIDELRQEGETRFARLLKELPAEALAAYKERQPAWGDLMDLRLEVVRRLEKKNAAPDMLELAAFADRETLLKRAKAARLSLQELEVFELITKNPRLKYREIADKLGISTSQVGVIKHRIKNKLAAGF